MPDILVNMAASNLGRYVVAHNRDRDYYQVAAALAEVGSLECLVTDYYSDGSGKGLDRRLSHRRDALIPKELTSDIPTAVLIQSLIRKSPVEKWRWTGFDMVDKLISRRARDVALRAEGADLLLYSLYAREAFLAPGLRDRRKCLFMFHPHPYLLQQILSKDVEATGIGHASLEEEVAHRKRTEILNDELQVSDLVLCASELTARSVIHAGVDPERVKVVPYGLTRQLPPYHDARNPDKLRFLFVGQAVHRKGIHHLLTAWRQSGLASTAELVLVCSRAMDGLLDNLPEGVILRSSLSTVELWEAFCSAHCFVLPALAEGFGLVLLEALAAGCYTVFSENTGFSGIGLPDAAGQEVAAGNAEALTATLQQVAEQFANGGFDHEGIRALATGFSPAAYREKLRRALVQHDRQ